MASEESAEVVPPVEVDWKVQGVFDPDGGGADFAYTVGLAAHGVDELHIWARPPDGVDPGDDWMLSLDDRCRILNRVASELISGHRNVGDRWVEDADGGFATMSFHLDGPFEAAELDAFGVGAGARVAGLRWELHRLPEPDVPVPMAPNTARFIAATVEGFYEGDEARAWVWECDTTGPVPFVDPVLESALGDGLAAPAEIIAAIRAVVRTDPDALVAGLVAGVAAAGELRSVAAVCAAAGRVTGRRSVLDAARVAAAADAELLIASEVDVSDSEWVEVLTAHLVLQLWVAYSGWILADVIDDVQLEAAVGWVMAVVDPGAAQDYFDAAFGAVYPGHPAAGVQVPDLGADELEAVVMAGSVRCAVTGDGAPLLDDPVSAWRRLYTAGFFTPD